MFRPKNEKERILHRLKIVLGHYKKVMQMVEDDVYCIDVLHQSMAVQKALREIDNLLLEQHLAGCVTDAMHQHQNQEKFMQEIMDVFKKQAAR
jgi:DNA-binding FrmR family transcriptional regulator